MAYNKRIKDADLPGNYVDGSVLLHTDMNKLETLTREGINANYEDIQKLQDGTISIANATNATNAINATNASNLGGASLSKQSDESLQDSDAKISSSKQVKKYVDDAVAGIITDYPDLTNKPQINGVTLVGNKTSSDLGIDIPIYYYDGQNNATNVAMFNELCDKFDDGEKFLLLGKVQLQNGYTYNGVFYDRKIEVLVPISVKDFTDYETAGTTYYSFMTDPVRTTGGYAIGGVKLTGTWGNFTACEEMTFSYDEGPAKKGDLKTVAFTGEYSDLTNKPSLATVATTGDYTDLLNKPTIPTVNNATLTIQKNGTTVDTFTANSSVDTTVDITVPTKTSDLTNNGDNLYDGYAFIKGGEDTSYTGDYTFDHKLTLTDDKHLSFDLENSSLPYANVSRYTLANTEELTAKDTLPTANSYYLGKIYQYTGTTNASYTNGYFYKCVSDGASTPTYSWERVEVQPNTHIYKYDSSSTVGTSSNPIVISSLEVGDYYFENSVATSHSLYYKETPTGVSHQLTELLDSKLTIIKKYEKNLPDGTIIGFVNTCNTSTNKYYLCPFFIYNSGGSYRIDVDWDYLQYKNVYYDIWNSKQAALVSGTNIKTINNTSILGSGNLTIGGDVSDVQVNGTTILSSGVANIVTNTAYNASTNKIATMSDVPSTPNVIILTESDYNALTTYADNTEYHIIEG